jgi:hypothetical protein
MSAGGRLSASVGRTTALTMFAPIKPGGTTWLRILFGAARRYRWVTEPLRRLEFIHYARWVIVDRLPAGPALPDPWVLFESNFEGGLPRYIDTFVRILPWRMRSMWGVVRGYPGLMPLNRFTAWAEANAFEESHYYCAYPDATPAMVGSALVVDRRFAELEAGSRRDPVSFEAAWVAFLTDVQRHL